MIRDLGAWAEARFAALCSEHGVTRNKSDQDRLGWDYFLQFPSATIAHLPIDAQPIEREALVQVKSKVKWPAAAVLKLSNALRLAKTPRPAFVVLFVAANGREPVRIYARHIWINEISRILERARRAGDPEKVDLHRMTLTLRMSQADDHTDDLIPWLAGQVGNGVDSYARAKAQIVATVGQEDGGIHGAIQVPLDALQALVDHQIGLPVAAPVEKVTIRQRRFGVDAILPLADARPQHVEMRASGRPIRLRLRGRGAPDVWLDAQLFRPAIPDLPREVFKVRIVADFLEIILPAEGDGQVNFTSHDEDQLPLALLKTRIEVMRASSAGSVEIVAVLDGDRLFEGEVALAGDFPARLDDLICLVSALQVTAAEVAPSALTISFADLVRNWNALADFHGFTAGQDMTCSVGFDSDIPQDVVPTSFMAYDYVEVGDWTFAAIVSREITLVSRGPAALSFKGRAPFLRESIVRRGPSHAVLADLKVLYAQAQQKVGPTVLALGYFGDLRAVANQSMDHLPPA